ncbi:MAG: hypothetical protein GY804_02505 [Alphaproteobacteria bacterium]|nr:hypothetical protein [Alphaproteobacteria bacterium]
MSKKEDEGTVGTEVAVSTGISATSKWLDDYFEEQGFEDYEGFEVDYPFPETTEGLIELLGEKIVHSNCIGAFTITLQNAIRRWAKKFINAAEEAGNDLVMEKLISHLQAEADKWKPGVVSRTRKSKGDKGMAIAEDMNEQELADFIDKLQAKASQVNKLS